MYKELNEEYTRLKQEAYQRLQTTFTKIIPQILEKLESTTKYTTQTVGEEVRAIFFKGSKSILSLTGRILEHEFELAAVINVSTANQKFHEPFIVDVSMLSPEEIIKSLEKKQSF